MDRRTQPQPSREGARGMKTPAFLHAATDLRSVPLMGEPKRKLGGMGANDREHPSWAEHGERGLSAERVQVEGCTYPTPQIDSSSPRIKMHVHEHMPHIHFNLLSPAPSPRVTLSLSD